MQETEKGIKWWIRYVIVPLIGSGGLVAVVVTIISIYSTPNDNQHNKLNDSITLPSGQHTDSVIARKREATRNYMMELSESSRLFENIEFTPPSTFDEVLRNPQEIMYQLRLIAGATNQCISRIEKIPSADVDIELISFVNRYSVAMREFASAARMMSDELADLIEYGETDMDSRGGAKRMEQAYAELEKLMSETKGLKERLAAKYGF